MEIHTSEKQIEDPSSSQAHVEHVDSPAGPARVPNGLRRIPRTVWLTLSAIALVSGLLAWHFQARNPRSHSGAGTRPTFLSLDWWTQPRVQNGDAALPDISGRIYGISIESGRVDNRDRMWIVGAGGLLAYSDDEGNCWTRFEYHADAGEFREPATKPCGGDDGRADVSWPQLLPTVFAAELAQSTTPSGKLPVQQQAPPQQQKRSTLQQQQQAPQQNTSQQQQQQQDGGKATVSSTEGQAPVFPTTINFGDVYLTGEASSNLKKRTFTLRNFGPVPARVFLSGFTGDGNNEFHLEVLGCDQKAYGPQAYDTVNVLTLEKECDLQVVLDPKTVGKKEVTLNLQSSDWPKPVTVAISANVHDLRKAADQGKPSDQGNTKPAPPKPSEQPVNGVNDISVKPPSVAPDLLTIGEFPDATIVSTGGWVWKRKDGAWIGECERPGSSVWTGIVKWSFEGPANQRWATETRVANVTALDLATTGQYKCADCTIRADVMHRWAVGWSTDTAGEHGVILRSRDGGKSWEAMSRGALAAQERLNVGNLRTWMWPPNWYWAVFIMTVLLAIPALLPPPDVSPPEGPSSSVEGRLSSDKPLDPGDLDVLGLTGIALGLSRFLRNKKTLPPLTIAVNGEWGSGKSSLMNLLRCDLKSYGMRPVWFNAWHHQKEEYLLAALLQTVRLEAVPPIWNLLGIPFRIRLLRRRFRRRWPALVLLGCVLIFVTALDYHLRIPGAHRSNLFLWIADQFTSPGKTPQGLSTLPLHGGFLAIIATIAAMWKGMTAFGANPAVLLASVAKGNKIKDLDAQTSFRQRFAVEFRDFTQALGPKRPLVVFIDDLDRCLPENVRDVLEAVNFLVSSGDCFVVLGIDRAQVQRAIGLSFKEVAEEAGRKDVMQAGINPAVAAAELAREKRAEFAQKYLEKLINLEVRVPQAADEGTKQQLFKRPTEPHPEPKVDKALRFTLQFSKWAVPLALALLLLGGTARLGKMAVPSVESWINETVPTPEPDTSKKVEVNVSNAASASPSSPPVVTPKPARQSPGASSSNKGEENGEVVLPVSGPAPKITLKGAWPARWILSLPLYLAAVFLLLVADVALTTRPGVVTHDSQEFTDAMERVWYPLVLAKQNTPRAAKRFLNRVRYLAMRQRGYQEHASVWERVLFPDRLREPARPHGWQPIPEPLLVALAAIEQVQPQWVYDDGAFKQITGSNGIADLVSKFPASIPEAAKLLETARALHQATFGELQYAEKHANWESLPSFRSTFVSIWPQLNPESA
jgi:KAP-like P-loop domain-containing protein